MAITRDELKELVDGDAVLLFPNSNNQIHKPCTEGLKTIYGAGCFWVDGDDHTTGPSYHMTDVRRYCDKMIRKGNEL
jgi:hypothetical protein